MIDPAGSEQQQQQQQQQHHDTPLIAIDHAPRTLLYAGGPGGLAASGLLSNAYRTALKGGVPSWSNVKRGFQSARVVAVPGLRHNDIAHDKAKALAAIAKLYDLEVAKIIFRTTKRGRLTVLATHENAASGVLELGSIADGTTDIWHYPGEKVLPIEWREGERIVRKAKGSIEQDTDIAKLLKELAKKWEAFTHETVAFIFTTTFAVIGPDGLPVIVDDRKGKTGQSARNTSIIASSNDVMLVEKSTVTQADLMGPYVIPDLKLIDEHGRLAVKPFDFPNEKMGITSLAVSICGDLQFPMQEGALAGRDPHSILFITPALGPPTSKTWKLPPASGYALVTIDKEAVNSPRPLATARGTWYGALNVHEFGGLFTTFVRKLIATSPLTMRGVAAGEQKSHSKHNLRHRVQIGNETREYFESPSFDVPGSIDRKTLDGVVRNAQDTPGGASPFDPFGIETDAARREAMKEAARVDRELTGRPPVEGIGRNDGKP